ncbi:MAG: hypothetical protein JW750_03470, partial [Anaerolineaceae bacterium]|nr:hypothetical protein [Anaerolineaceae bacterium]
LSLADTLATYGDQLDDSLWARQLYVCEMLFKAYWHQNGQIVNPPRLINGNDLIQQFGLQPGPKFRHLLEAVREAQAEGSILSRDDALNLVAKIINEPDVPSVE